MKPLPHSNLRSNVLLPGFLSYHFCKMLISNLPFYSLVDYLSNWFRMDFPALFIVFQVFRLASLVMFSIFVIDCTLYYDTTSVDCGNFTLYSMPVCDAYCWKAIWLICSILTATICICLMKRSSFPVLRPFGYTEIWKCLIRKPYFWSLNSITSLVIIYDILIMYQNRGAKIYIECLVAASKIWTLYLTYSVKLHLSTLQNKTLSSYYKSSVLYYSFDFRARQSLQASC